MIRKYRIGNPIPTDSVVKEIVLSEGTIPYFDRNDEKKELIKRLRRAEGQIRGIEKMIEEDAYCPDILTQAAALPTAAKASPGRILPSSPFLLTMHPATPSRSAACSSRTI